MSSFSCEKNKAKKVIKMTESLGVYKNVGHSHECNQHFF
jgi:hypothetical protein